MIIIFRKLRNQMKKKIFTNNSYFERLFNVMNDIAQLQQVQINKKQIEI